MAKGTTGRRRNGSRRCRATPYPLPSANHSELVHQKKCSKLFEKKDWEDATCSVCMEYPHNAVLLLCSSHDKGCRPYMCGTSLRYSNCLDQYKKAYTKATLPDNNQPMPSATDTPTADPFSAWPSEKSEVSEVACPLCRGQVKGWTVVEPAREYLNTKKRSCMQDDCSFVGSYKEIRKHVKAEHPFAYFLLNKTVTIKLLLATAFVVVGNIFLVAFGNHQSPVYTPEQLVENYTNLIFLLYSLSLVLVVVLHHSIYSRGKGKMLVPFSFAVVSGAIGSCSVLFAKSLSNMLRLSMSSSSDGYSALNSGFTYSMLLMFLSTGGFWMSRLNEGLSRFDAILIVPMFQIAWTFFSICTGFVYFEEYKVFDALRTTMFVLGMISVFVGIYLLAPEDDESLKGGEVLKDGSLVVSKSSNLSQDVEGLFIPSDQIKDIEIIWTRYADENC